MLRRDIVADDWILADEPDRAAVPDPGPGPGQGGINLSTQGAAYRGIIPRLRPGVAIDNVVATRRPLGGGALFCGFCFHAVISPPSWLGHGCSCVRPSR